MRSRLFSEPFRTRACEFGGPSFHHVSASVTKPLPIVLRLVLLCVSVCALRPRQLCFIHKPNDGGPTVPPLVLCVSRATCVCVPGSVTLSRV